MNSSQWYAKSKKPCRKLQYDAGAAVELLLNKLAGVTETHSAPATSTHLGLGPGGL